MNRIVSDKLYPNIIDNTGGKSLHFIGKRTRVSQEIFRKHGDGNSRDKIRKHYMAGK